MRQALVLVDTSVWIDALRKSSPENLRIGLETVLLEQRVAITPLIKMELLSGVLNKTEFHKLKEELDALHQLEFTSRVWELSSELGFSLRRKGFVVPNTDLILASTASVYNCQLWHNDKHFDLIAKHWFLQIFKGGY